MIQIPPLCPLRLERPKGVGVSKKPFISRRTHRVHREKRNIKPVGWIGINNKIRRKTKKDDEDEKSSLFPFCLPYSLSTIHYKLITRLQVY